MSRATLWLVAALGMAIGAAGMVWMQAYGVVGGLRGADRAAVERVVRDYIVAHPEIVPEAMQRLQDRDTADQRARAGKVAVANRAAIATPFAAAWAGNADPDVTLVEYFDYNCGYCRASLPAIAQLLASDRKVRVVYRDYPILTPESVDAARISLAAAEQGRFQAFHDALYAAGPVSAATIAAASRVAGLDLARARAFAPRADAEIAANKAMARQLELPGTPGWVIGNTVIPSAAPLATLRQAVAAARAAR